MEKPIINLKPAHDDTGGKGNTDLSGISDTPQTRSRPKFDVSQEKKGSVIIVDYKNESPFNKRPLSTSKMSKFANTPKNQGLIKPRSAFAKPQQGPSTPSSQSGMSPANSGRKKLAKVISFTKLQRLLVDTKNFGRENAAVALRNIIKRELEERLRKQENESYDLGEKITAMCISNDGKNVILATHYVEAAPKIKANPLETLQTEELITRQPEEKNLLNFSTPFNNDILSNQVDDNAVDLLGQDSNVASNKSRYSQPSVLWLFDLDKRVFERLPMEDLQETEKEITCLAMTNNNKYFLCGWSDKSVHLYDLENKTRKYSFRDVCKYNVTSLAITSDDNFFVAGGAKDRSISVYNLQRKSLLYTLDDLHKDYLQSVLLTPDNSQIIVGFLGGTIKIINRQNREISKTFDIFENEDKQNLNFIGCMKLTNDGRSIVVGCHDCSIKVLDLQTGKEVCQFLHIHERRITSLSITSDDRYIMSGSYDGSIASIDLEKRERIHTFPHVQSKMIACLLVSPNNKHILSGSIDGVLHVIDLERKELLGEINQAHKGGVDTLAVSGNNQYIASGSYDGSLAIHHLETQNCLHYFENLCESPIKAVIFSHDNKYIITGGDDRSIKIIVMHTWEIAHTFHGIHEGWVTTLATTLDHNFLVSGSNDRSIKVISLVTNDLIHTYFNAHNGAVLCLKIASDNKTLISGGQDGSIKIFNLKAKKRGVIHHFEEAHFGPVKCLSLTKDNRYFVSGSTDKSIKVFSLEKRECLHTIEDAHEDTVNSIAMTIDGKYIVSTSNDKSIRMFDFGRKKRLYSFENAHNESISTVVVTENNLSIISGSNDNSIKIFTNPYNLKTLTVTESDRISPLSYLGLFTLNYFLNESDPEIKNRMIIKYQDLNIYPQNLNLFHIVAVFFPQKELISFCLESKIPFTGDFYGRTPLHFLLNSDKIDFSNINFLLENFDKLMLNTSDAYDVMAEVTRDLPTILRLSPSLVVNLLKYAVGNPLSYQNEEITHFGSIIGGTNRRSVPYRIPIFTPEIKSKLLDEEGNQLLSIKLVLLYMDYDLCSKDLLRTLHALESVDSEEIFKTKAISVLVDYAWAQSKRHLYVLMTLYSAFMVFLSFYASQTSAERSFWLEVVLLVSGCCFLLYETLQLVSAGIKIYATDVWNYVDVTGNILLLATIIADWCDADKLSKQWLMTITLFLGYAKWVSFFRIIDQTRKLIRIIIEIVKDIRSFIALLFAAIMGYSLIFYQFDDEVEISYSGRLLIVYNLLYAQFDTEDFNSHQIFYFVVVTITLSVILLNMLIALMGGTYKRVQETSILADYKEKILLTLETITIKRIFQKMWNFLMKKRKMKKESPYLLGGIQNIKKSYLFFVEDSRLQNDEENGEKQWEKRLITMKKLVNSEMQQQYEILQKKILGLENQIHRQESKVATLRRSHGDKLTELERNMTKALNTLQ